MFAVNLPMPKNCQECMFRFGYDNCLLRGECSTEHGTRIEGCPLIEVKKLRARQMFSLEDISLIGKEKDIQFAQDRCGQLIGKALMEEKGIAEMSTTCRIDEENVEYEFNVYVVAPHEGSDDQDGSSAEDDRLSE